jgi:hypothetical protein
MYSEEGKTLTFISQYFHCRTEAIKAVCFKYNIPIKKRGLSKNRTAKEDFFEKIDSEEKAYFLGLMFSDGSVVNDIEGKRSPQISLELKVSDEKIIEEFRNILNLHSKVTYRKEKGKECARLSFRSKKMAEDLKKYGIIPNKTYITKHLPEIDNQYLKPFLRGLIDGDGSIYQIQKTGRYAIDFCSYHKSICEDFRQLCNTFLSKKNKNVIANYDSAYHIRFYKQETVIQLATELYKDAKVSLARKQLIANKLFRG